MVGVHAHLNMAMVQRATTPDDARRCWPVFRELRLHLESENEFMERWRTQRLESYAIAFIEDDGEVVAVAGFRIMNTMAWGKLMYLDDLAVLTTRRGHGYGSVLLGWLKTCAREQACNAIHLDTGYQRYAAHKIYLRNDFQLGGHHLIWDAKSQ